MFYSFVLLNLQLSSKNFDIEVELFLENLIFLDEHFVQMNDIKLNKRRCALKRPRAAADVSVVLLPSVFDLCLL